MDEALKSFRDEIDNDRGLQSKRSAIITSSSILVVIYWTDAQIKDFTGLIATIEMRDAHNFKCLLMIAIIYQLIRYYGYANKYHKKLRAFWVEKFLNDPKVFKFDNDGEKIIGLIGRAVSIYVPDSPGIVSCEYESYRKLLVPFWGRNISYMEKDIIQIDHDNYEEYIYKEIVPLNVWNENWNWKDYVELINIEYRYRWGYYLSSREYLDLMGPYVFGIIAIVPFSLWPLFKKLWLVFC